MMILSWISVRVRCMSTYSHRVTSSQTIVSQNISERELHRRNHVAFVRVWTRGGFPWRHAVVMTLRSRGDSRDQMSSIFLATTTRRTPLPSPVSSGSVVSFRLFNGPGHGQSESAASPRSVSSGTIDYSKSRLLTSTLSRMSTTARNSATASTRTHGQGKEESQTTEREHMRTWIEKFAEI